MCDILKFVRGISGMPQTTAPAEWLKRSYVQISRHILAAKRALRITHYLFQLGKEKLYVGQKEY